MGRPARGKLHKSLKQREVGMKGTIQDDSLSAAHTCLRLGIRQCKLLRVKEAMCHYTPHYMPCSSNSLHLSTNSQICFASCITFFLDLKRVRINLLFFSYVLLYIYFSSFCPTNEDFFSYFSTYIYTHNYFFFLDIFLHLSSPSLETNRT